MNKSFFLPLIFVGASAIFFLPGCASSAPSLRTEICDARSLSEIEADPLLYQSDILCGKIYVRAYGGTWRATQSIDEEPSDDIAFVISSDGRRYLGQIDGSPKSFLVRARIELQNECFEQRRNPLDPAGCLPFGRPVFLHILSAIRQ